MCTSSNEEVGFADNNFCCCKRSNKAMALKEEALSVKKRRRSNKWRENELGVELW